VPELPEVETVREGLERHAVGRTVEAARIVHPRAVRRDPRGPAGFEAAMAGRPLKKAERRGKYLWLTLDDDEALLAHLGMSGQLLVGNPVPIAHIAPDPMEDAFDGAKFAARLRRKQTGVKRALLDQSLVSGVGNIYADEALWRAKLHWARPTETLRGPEVSRLLAAITEVLGEALRAGGTSFDALYVNVNGESGYFDRSLNAYGREGEPCGRCGTAIRRDAFMNRSSYSCPRCQPRPRNAHW
jgi:formamidopyrimidine-DNA glycosylase